MIDVDPFVPWLEGKGRNDFSQFGEDGIIEAALAHYGVVHRRCFEFGAADGVWLSNTKRLRDLGWSAVLIESDPSQYDRLRDNTERERVTCCMNEGVTPENVNDLLMGDFDLGVIDIDGPDYWVWEALRIKPRLMLVEFACGSRFTPEASHYVPPKGETRQAHQAGYGAILALGRSKGYAVLAAMSVNLLFALEQT
jgi:hypothetical protein